MNKSERSKKVIFYSAAWRGGAGWFVHDLAVGIAEAGMHVLLVSPRSDPVARDAAHPRVKRLVLPRGAGGVGSFIYRALRSGWRIVASYIAIIRARPFASQYLVTHLDWLLTGFFQLLLIRTLGARLTYIVHDAKPHAWAFPRALRWLEVAMLRGSYRLSSHIVTLTSAARVQLINEFGIAPDRVTVIPHGVFETPDMPPLPGNSKILVFGMLRRNKRILETIEALSLLPEECRASLIIAGAVHAEDPDYWRQCEEAISRCPGRVRSEVGFVPEARVPQLLEECDGVILPYEEFNSQSGVAILAAMAGRPLIATDVGGIGELMAAGMPATRIRRPVTSQTIADALVAFCGKDISLHRADGQAARAMLIGNLSWNKIGEKYAELMAE